MLLWKEGSIFFDTARLYGESEWIMGKAFHDRREKVVIATKCRHFRDGSGRIPPYAELKRIVDSSLKESLEALQTDRVDVFMLHQADEAILENKELFRGKTVATIICGANLTEEQVEKWL